MSLNPHLPGSSDVIRSRTLRQQKSTNSPVVLIVDDNETEWFDMKNELELNGYSVIETDNGQDAVVRATFTQPDLILIDLNIPLLYQLVAARQILKQARIGTVPIIIVTREEETDPHLIMEVGVRRNEYVTRLSNRKQLENLLDAILPCGPDAA